MTPTRPTILFFAILVGFALQFTAAHARDIQTAVVAGGCFWCVESDFDKVNGVVSTTSGYTGGTTKNPTYKKLNKGGTGHYEAVQIKFDADIISYRELIDIFWRTVDPLDAGGQFCDRGDSYRTAVFVNGKSQRVAAEASKVAADAAISGKIVTEILNAKKFYPAEAYHQNYYLGKKRVVTRFGLVQQSTAYKKYRKGCGRDKRVRQIWGAAAPFAGS
jgi:peptide-methionine (S)-S-oxide reductase